MRPVAVAHTRRRIVAVTAGLALLGVGAAVYAGAQVQSNLGTRFEQLKTNLESTGLVQIEEKPLRRSLTGGTQETVLTFDAGGAPSHLTIVNHISNGPFPGLRAFGAAVVDTELHLDPDVQAAFDKALGGHKPFIRTVVGFGGNTTTNVVVPSGRFARDGATLTWQAVSAVVRGEGARAVIDGRWPGLTFDDGESRATLRAARLFSDSVLAPDGLSDGQSRLEVQQFDLLTNGQTLKLSGVQAGSETRADGPTLSGAVTYGVKRLEAGNTTLDDLKLDVSLRGFDRAALVRLGRVGAGLRSAPDDQALSTMMSAFAQLLSGHPEFSIDRLSVHNAGGEVKLAAKAALNGAGLDPNTLLIDPAALMERLNVDATGSAPEAALRGLLGTNADETLRDLRQSGFVTFEDGTYRATFSLKRGVALLNGAPLH